MIHDSREAFEKWCILNKLNTTRNNPYNDWEQSFYMDESLDVAYLAWQASKVYYLEIMSAGINQ